MKAGKVARKLLTEEKSNEKSMPKDAGPSEYMEVEQFAKPSLVVAMVENMHSELIDLSKENLRQNVECTSLVLLAACKKVLQERS